MYPSFLVYENKGIGPDDLRQLIFHYKTPLMGGEWTASVLNAAMLICFTYWVSR